MKFSAAIQRRLHWLNLPVVLLVALLQRTPLLRMVASAEERLRTSPLGVILKSTVATLASLGAVNSLAGATPLVPSQGTGTGVTLATGQPVTIAYTVTGTMAQPESWRVTGQVPPGLDFSGLTSSGTVNVTNLILSGTPTTPGSYSLSIQTFQFPGGEGIASPVFSYTIAVTGGSTSTAPSFTTHPQSQTVAAGGNATFTVAADGSPSPTLQWRRDNVNLPGQTGATLALTNISAANAGSYTVVATNSAGSATSNPAVLTVTAAPTAVPTITAQPIGVTVLTGQKVALVAGASGAGLSYQWRGVTKGVIVGATSPLFVVSSALPSDQDSYFCRISNSAGSVDTTTAAVAVVASAGTPGYLRALSLRGNVGAGADAFFVGFVIEGGTARSVLVKGNGPGLATLFNVPGAMVDPRLDLSDANTSAALGFNDNWGGTPELTLANNAAGAFPLPDPNSKDAAMRVDLSPGTYIAKVGGVNNTTGVALVEIYGLSVPANLRALSLRGNAGAGADVFFLGFVVAGDTAKTVLVKSVGPGLATLFGVPGAMVDPTLELSNANTSQALGGNDNWGGGADLSIANSAVGAFPLQDPNSKDSAMLITLPPGTYIAKVGGANNTTGVVLVEIYGL